jgi:hypothetical protein
MKKLKAALHVFVKSLTSISYYQDLLKTDLKFSLKYYVVLALIFTAVTSVSYSFTLIPQIEKGINEGLEYALNLFEDDLVITLEEGKMSINKEEPYVVPLEDGVSSGPENLIVFDTEGTLEDLNGTYSSLVLVNEVNVLVQAEGQSPQVYSLSNFPDGSYDKEDLVDAVERVRSFVRFVPYLVGLSLVLGVLFYYLVFRLFYLFVVAVLLALAGAFRGLSLSYGKYYKIAIHAMTLPMSIEVVRIVFSWQIDVPYWFMFLNLLFGVLVVMKLGSPEGEDSASSISSESPVVEDNEQ